MILSRLSHRQIIHCRSILQTFRHNSKAPLLETHSDAKPLSSIYVTSSSTDLEKTSSWAIRWRQMSSSSSSSGGGDGGKSNTSDPFGISYQDDETKLGPEAELPPHYIRDPVSGKITGETKMELTSEEQRLLDMSEEELETLKIERLMESWEKTTDENDGDSSSKEDEVAQLIRNEKMKLNTFGRQVSDVPKLNNAKHQDLDDLLSDTDPDPSAPLSPKEFASFQAYLKKHHDTSITKEDVPTVDTPVKPATDEGFDPDQDLSWIKTSSLSQSPGAGNDDNSWMEDILPSDLAPPRKLNRKEAKPIPKQLLHQNNLALLRRYVTPGGQIVNRVQSRLGAKDQRKVAKLIKRARALGLIPYVGQWKYEDHGDLFAEDIQEERPWEQELKERGLEIEHKLEDYQKD